MSGENTFGTRLATVLDETPGSASRLAQQLGISTAAVSAWKKRGANPKIDHIATICRVLEVDANWLLGLTDHRNSLDGGRGPETELPDDAVLEIVDKTLWMVQRDLFRALEEEEGMSSAAKRRLMVRFNSFGDSSDRGDERIAE